MQFNDDNHFKIIQLTDIHLGERHDLDAKTGHLIKDLLVKEKPDFIAITGDWVSGYKWDQEHVPFWEFHHASLANALGHIHIPWGFVPGYHDYEADIDEQRMLELESIHKLSVSRKNDYKHNGHDLHK